MQSSFFLNNTANTEIYTLSLHDALPIYRRRRGRHPRRSRRRSRPEDRADHLRLCADRKSTRLNSSHVRISYAVFCLKKKNVRYEENKTIHINLLHKHTQLKPSYLIQLTL